MAKSDLVLNTEIPSEMQFDRLSVTEGAVLDTEGSKPQLQKNFSLLSLAGIGLVVGNVWPALGGSILVAIYNGGAPGVIYEFITVSVFYWAVAASIAELASSMPSSAGPYLWASITPGKKYGRVIGFFAGYWNCLGWIFAAASMSFIAGNICVQMYAVNQPSFTASPWHVFLASILCCWSACAVVCFGNKIIPHLNNIGIFFILGGVLITVIVCVVMPSRNGTPYATNSQVWSEFTADIGYPSGFVFVAGMLNGAYAVGTPDAVSHLAEEIGRPELYVPIAIGLQMGIGFITGFAYLVSILYVITDYEALFASAFPIAEIYYQATSSAAGTTGLLCLLLFPILLCVIGIFVTSGRNLWALARDGATPFPQFVSKISESQRMPLIATLICATFVTILGCIYLGSQTAFNAFVGSFVLMTSASYIAAILPHLLKGRQGIKKGPFTMPGMIGYLINSVACGYMIVWFVIYCFPYSLPTTAASMNYSCLIWGGLTCFVGLWWVLGARRRYTGFSSWDA